MIIPSRLELENLVRRKHLTDDQIGQMYHRSRTQVRRWKKEHGIRGFHNNRMSESSLKLPIEEWKFAYLAAMIDAEGSIIIENSTGKARSSSTTSLKHPNLRPLIVVANTGRPLIDWLVTNFGGRFYVRSSKSPSLGRKPVYVWTMNPIACLNRLLPRIIPYLLLKGSEALAAQFLVRERMVEHGFDPNTGMSGGSDMGEDP